MSRGDMILLLFATYFNVWYLFNYHASRVSLRQSPSSTFPTFYISISRHSYKPTLPGFNTSFEVPHPETWTGFQTFGAL